MIEIQYVFLLVVELLLDPIRLLNLLKVRLN
jgi:hypothetical protein